jgi:hypothetical protein
LVKLLIALILVSVFANVLILALVPAFHGDSTGRKASVIICRLHILNSASIKRGNTLPTPACSINGLVSLSAAFPADVKEDLGFIPGSCFMPARQNIN